MLLANYDLRSCGRPLNPNPSPTQAGRGEQKGHFAVFFDFTNSLLQQAFTYT